MSEWNCTPLLVLWSFVLCLFTSVSSPASECPSLSGWSLEMASAVRQVDQEDIYKYMYTEMSGQWSLQAHLQDFSKVHRSILYPHRTHRCNVIQMVLIPQGLKIPTKLNSAIPMGVGPQSFRHGYWLKYQIIFLVKGICAWFEYMSKKEERNRAVESCMFVYLYPTCIYQMKTKFLGIAPRSDCFLFYRDGFTYWYREHAVKLG